MKFYKFICIIKFSLRLSLIKRGLISNIFLKWPSANPRLRSTHLLWPPFGRHLAAIRRARGWSQEALALESALARSYLSGVERGLRNIALVNICKLAATLSISPTVLMDFETAA